MMPLTVDGAPLDVGASPIRRILACHDGGSASRYVVPWARAMATSTGADVTLLRVLAPPTPQADAFGLAAGLWATPAVLARDRADAQLVLDKSVAALARGGVAARGVVVEGSAADEVVREAKERKADLLILGSHGRGRFGRVLIGSVADAVKDRVAASVLIARSPAHPKIVLHATDDSPPCRHAIALGESLARAWGARSVHIHVHPQRSAAWGIVTEARGRGAGLVVVGSRGLGALASIALGSVSTSVVHQAPCSVLVVKEGAG